MLELRIQDLEMTVELLQRQMRGVGLRTIAAERDEGGGASPHRSAISPILEPGLLENSMGANQGSLYGAPEPHVSNDEPDHPSSYRELRKYRVSRPSVASCVLPGQHRTVAPPLSRVCRASCPLERTRANPRPLTWLLTTQLSRHVPKSAQTQQGSTN